MVITTMEEALIIIGTQGFTPEQILTPSNTQVKNFPILIPINKKKSFFFKAGNSEELGKNLESTGTPLGLEALCLHLIESQLKGVKK